MTEENYETAHVLLHDIKKLEAIKAKIKREFPEFEYDSQAKEIGQLIYNTIDEVIKLKRNYFESL